MIRAATFFKVLFGLERGRKGAVGHCFANGVSLDPRFDRGPSTLESGGDLANQLPLVDDELSDSKTGARSQGSVSVRHKRTYLD